MCIRVVEKTICASIDEGMSDRSWNCQTTEIDQQAAIIKTSDDPYICDIREQYKKHQYNNETSGPFGEANSSILQGILGIGNIAVARSKTVFNKKNLLLLCDLFSVYHCNCMISFTIVYTDFCRFYHVEMKN